MWIREETHVHPQVLKPPATSIFSANVKPCSVLAGDFQFNTGHSKKHIRWNKEF